jgi:hypothetical protein
LESESFFGEAEAARSELVAARAATDKLEARLQSALADRQGAERERAELAAQLGTCRQALDSQRDEAQALTDEQRMMGRERELLRLQVLQLNAEVSALKQPEQPAPESAPANRSDDVAKRWKAFWWQQQPTDVVLDLRQDVEGSNWYHAETDGRWTGPLAESTLLLPALAPGRYTVELQVVGSMGPEIVEGVEIFINDVRIRTTRAGKKHPYTMSGVFVADQPLSDAPSWQFSVRVPKVISPAERGAADQRQLGVRVGRLKFTRLQRG